MIGRGADAEAMAGRPLAPFLAHVNLLLVLYGGAALATAARLKWDPSTYIAVREVFPTEYAALASVTTAAGAVMLLLPHLATAGLHASRNTTRRILLYIYAGAMSVLVVGEVALAVWLTQRIRAWLDSEAAEKLMEALELREHIRPILKFIGRWHPLPQHIDKLIHEAEQDAPRNLYVAGACVVLLAILQPLAIVLALRAARRGVNAVAGSSALVRHDYSAPEYRDVEKAPLHAARA